MKSDAEPVLIDLLIHPARWIGNARYRNAMLSRPFPPHTWRFVCRDPMGGIQIVACVSFMANDKRRTMRARLRDVK